MNVEIKELHHKVDILTEELFRVTSKIQPMEELKEDIALFSTDAFNEVITFLADIDFHYRSDDMKFFIKNVLVNLKNITATLQSLQSFAELAEDVQPLATDIFNEVLEKLHQMEKHLLFESLEQMLQFPVKFNESFSPDDIHGMEDSVITILTIFNTVSKSGVIDSLSSAIQETEASKPKKKKAGLFRILKLLRNRNVSQQINYGITILEKFARIQNQKEAKNA